MAKSKHMLNYFKLSLFFFLHIKFQRARTRRLQYFCFYFSDFKQTSSTLKVQTHETYQHQGQVQLQPEAGKRCHSPSQVTDSWECMLAGAGPMLGTANPSDLPREACVWTLPCTAGEGTVLIFLPSWRLYYMQQQKIHHTSDPMLRWTKKRYKPNHTKLMF